MKKILLASTILVGTAGVAAADVSFSGSAYAGVGYNLTTDEFAPEVMSDFTATMTTTTDGGLEAGASITVTAPGVYWNDTYTDSSFGMSLKEAGGISDSSVYLSGDFGKLAVVYDNDGSTGTNYDVNFVYSNTWGDFGISAYYTMAPVGLGMGTNGDLGATVTYSFGDYSVYAEYDYDAYDATAAGAEHLIGFGADATFSGFSIGVDLDYSVTNDDLDWKADASYTTGPYTIGAFIAEDDAGINYDFDFGATASYDLGGGVSVDAAYTHDDATDQNLVTLGVSMAF